MSGDAEEPVRGRTVLVVEDSATQRLKLVWQLRQQGYEVAEARDAADAEAYMASDVGLPDAVLLDWELPDEPGPDLLARWSVHPEYRWVPVLMVTAHDAPDMIRHALSLGATDYVSKPFSSIELEARLNSAVRMRELQEELRRVAHRDPLTGLLNRRALFQRLEDELARARRYSLPLAVSVVDLDHFKRVNDTYGHDVGDDVLRAVSDILVREAREVDVVGRLGGEEFLLVLPETTLAEACIALERCRAAVEVAPWTDVAVGLTLTMSAGVYGFDGGEHGDDAIETLVKRADEALYGAKFAGRNQVSTTA